MPQQQLSLSPLADDYEDRLHCSKDNPEGLHLISLVVEFTPLQAIGNISIMKRHCICDYEEEKAPLQFSVLAASGGPRRLGTNLGLAKGLNKPEAPQPPKEL